MGKGGGGGGDVACFLLLGLGMHHTQKRADGSEVPWSDIGAFFRIRV